MIDITQNKLFNGFIEFSNDAILVANEEGDILVWNSAQEKISGISFNIAKKHKVWKLQWMLMLEEHKKDISPNNIKKKYQDYFNNDNDTEVIETEIKNIDGSIKRISQRLLRSQHEGRPVLVTISRDDTSVINTKNNLDKTIANYNFLTDSFRELSNYNSVRDVYSYVAKKLSTKPGFKGLIAISDYSDQSNTWKLIEVEGMPSIIEKLSKLLGIDIEKLSGKITTDFYRDMIEGELVKLPDNLVNITEGIVKSKLESIVKKLLKYKSIYSISFKEKQTIYGSLTFLLSEGSEDPDKLLIEAFIRQISVYINKITAESGITELNKKYKTIVENSSEGIYIYKGDRFIFVNTAACILSGYSYDEILKMKVWNFIHEDDRQKVIDYGILRAQGKDCPSVYRAKVNCKNGEAKDCEFSVSTIPLEDELVVLGVVKDLSNQQKVEQALKVSEDKYKTAFHTSPDAILITRLKDGLYVSVNNGFTKNMGYSATEVIGKTGRDLNFWNKVEEREILIEELTRNHFVENMELEFISKNGTILHVLMSASILNISGEPHIISISRDISERIKSQKLHNVFYNISRFSFNNIDLHTFIGKIHQQIGLILEARNFYVALYNKEDNTYTFPYYIDETENVIDNEKFDLTGSLTDYIRKTGQGLLSTDEIEDELRKSDDLKIYGEQSLVWVGAPLIKSITNEVYGVIAIQDYHNKNAYQEKDLKIFEIIAFNISVFIERIQSIKAIEDARKNAEKADRLKSAFLANMSHEIRTPMNGILGFTNLLENPSLSGDEKNKYVGIIKSSGNRMLNTVNDIIDISKIDSGQVELSKNIVNIVDEIELNYQFFKQEASKKGLQLFVVNKLEPNSLNIETDHVKLNSILTNLIKNAIKYTDSGYIEIGFERKNKSLYCYVKDTGIGIPDDRIKAVFNRFEQADIDDVHARQGSGLGLAISKSYVNMMDGKIWVRSEIGKGSTFHFMLPWKTDQYSISEVEEQLVENNIPTKKLNILIAEDDEFSLQHLKILLHDVSDTILAAGTGLDVVKIAKENPMIDCVLMDLKMPIMDGYEATRKIREFNKDVRIIAQSAYAMPRDREKAFEAGCNDYITKPIDKDQLISKLLRPKLS